MAPTFHPEEDLLLSQAACSEHPAVDLLVSTHAALCEECRRAIEDMEFIAATLLEEESAMEVSSQATERALAAARSIAEAPAPAALERTRRNRSALPAEISATVSYVLSLRDAGDDAPWRWAAPGVQEVRLPLDWNGVPVKVVRLKAGMRIPLHTHAGREMTLVLSGCLSDQHASYLPGDVADYDGSISHEQRVDAAEDCLCLVVNQSRLVPQTLLGRLFTWLAGA